MAVVLQDQPGIFLNKKQRQFLQDKKIAKVAGLVVAVVLVFVLINLYVVSIYTVDGISMHPTLYTGNVLLVWKVPITWEEITNGQYVPGRGNIVILKKTPVSGEDLVKRVVGLPGETIVIGSGKVTIYNSTHPNGFNPDLLYFPHGEPFATAGSVDSNIGPGHIFVMGDNRVPGASIDSRSSIGPVPPSNIEGRVVLRLYPFDKITLF